MPPETATPANVVVAVRQPASLRGLLALLSQESWVVHGVSDSRALYLALLHRPQQILVLSPDLPPEGGVAVIRQLRQVRSTASCGILVLAEPGSGEALAALTAGADACASPTNAEEIKAYIRALDRRLRPESERNAEPLWHYSQQEWKLVTPSGGEIRLSHMEAAFVHLIVRQAGRPVRRRDIISQAFGQDPLHYDQRRLEALVSRLRKKVHRSYPLSQPIRVVHSIGYVFAEAVRCMDLPDGPSHFRSK